MVQLDPRLYAPTWAPPVDEADDELREELRLIAYALRDMARALDELAAGEPDSAESGRHPARRT